MALQPAVSAFRDWLLGEYRADARYDDVRALDGPEARGADLCVRLCAGERSYYEVRVLLDEKQVQAGFATEGRMTNEAIEQMVLDNGGELDELLNDELSDLGAASQTMEHFFERPAFRYMVRLPLRSPEALQDAELRKQVTAVLKACRLLFQDAIDSEP